MLHSSQQRLFCGVAAACLAVLAAVASIGPDEPVAPAPAAAAPEAKMTVALLTAVVAQEPPPLPGGARPVPLSPPARRLLLWALANRDNEGAAFAIIDKQQAHLWLYAPDGRPVGDTPVLVGLARGDASVQGIGGRPMAQIKPTERITPAGRFVAEPGQNADGVPIFWVDYDAAVSLHRVRPNVPAERRLERLASPSAAAKRITWGCINVPMAFYDQRLSPLFLRSHGVVYLLPETMPLESLFKPAALHVGGTL